MGRQLTSLDDLDWSAEDIVKKFDNTFVLATVYGKPPLGQKANNSKIKLIDNEVVYIKCGHSDQVPGILRVCKSVPPDGLQNFEVAAKDVVIEEDRANPCLSNFGDCGAFIYMWNPERQWKRGWCTSNAYLRSGPWDTNIYKVRVWGFERATLIAKPEHLPMDEAIKQFRSNKKVLGRAINNRYWLLRKEDDDVIQLYRRLAFMGSFLGNRFFMNEGAASIFHDEIEKELPVLKTKYGYAKSP